MNLLYKKMFTVLFSLFLISGCDQQNKKDDVENKINILSAKVSNLQRDIFYLQKVTHLLVKQESLLVKQEMRHSEVSFTPGSKGYSSLNSNSGIFLVALKSMKKYANGYAVVFDIGNPNMVTYHGVRITMHWGKPIKPEENFYDWRKTLKTQVVTIEKPLLPGVWNKVSVVLSPTTANETGLISISSLEADEISFYRDFRRAND